jgi:DNA helicase HerA-like ATPase
MLTIGTDLKTREPITLDASHARVMLICGKRGSGKSYTLGVLAEELFQQDPRPRVLIADPMGIFWTMSQPVGSSTTGLPVHLLVPGEPATAYPAPLLAHFQQLGIAVDRITLRPAELSADAWCELFALSINEPLGIAMARAVQALTDIASGFDLGDLEEAIQRDPLSQDRTKEALLNRLSLAKSWHLFDAHAADVMQRLNAEALFVLDLSVLDYGTHGLRSLVLAMVARNIFTTYHATRKHATVIETPHVPLWLLIDEAHQFIPQGSSTLAKDTLIRWVKEGRQPGLSCVLASQQPGSLEQDVLSQCDALISHKLTNLEDLQAANRLSQAYMGSELKVYLRHLKQPGQAVLVDDARERVAMLQVRPRRTRHGGGEL